MTEKELKNKYSELRPRYEDLEKFVVSYINDQIVTVMPKVSSLRLSNQILAIKSRIKNKDSFIEKAKRTQDGKLKYSNPFNQVHDILGVTIVCVSDNDLKSIVVFLRGLFPIIEGEYVENYAWRLEENKFGHRAIKIDFEITTWFASRIPKFDSNLIGLKFEVQITTALMYTWSKIQHDWIKWDDNFPKPEPLMRKLYATNALLELADNELSSIEKEMKKLKQYNIRDSDLNYDKLQAFCDTYFYDWRDGAFGDGHQIGLENLLKNIIENNFSLLDILDFYKMYKDSIIELEQEQMITFKPRVRWAQAGIINIIIDLMNPGYAEKRHKGTLNEYQILKQYDNWRKKYLPSKS